MIALLNYSKFNMLSRLFSKIVINQMNNSIITKMGA